MSGYQEDSSEGRSRRSRPQELGLWLLAIIAVLLIGVALEEKIGIPLATTLRIAAASVCLIFIYRLSTDFPEEQWPRIGFWLSLIVNIAIFFTPLVDRPISRGEVMLFALPDAIVVLFAMLIERIVSTPAPDVHQRAVRQQIILGIVLAITFCAILFTLVLIDPRTGHSTLH